jgi:hypothetical protein
MGRHCRHLAAVALTVVTKPSQGRGPTSSHQQEAAEHLWDELRVPVHQLQGMEERDSTWLGPSILNYRFTAWIFTSSIRIRRCESFASVSWSPGPDETGLNQAVPA